MLVVNEPFLRGEPVVDRLNETWTWAFGVYAANEQVNQLQNLFTNNTTYTHESDFQNLTNDECMRIYGTDFVSGHNHVLLVTSSGEDLNSSKVFFGMSETDSMRWSSVVNDITFGWICRDMGEPDVT